jgi:hypothetical protein
MAAAKPVVSSKSGMQFLRRGAVLVIVLLSAASSFAAGGIRDFDLRTIERLGAQLTNPPPSNSGVRARAKGTAMGALKGKLFNIRYSYAVLDDPDGSGFLVYALGHAPRKGDVVMHRHFRVTVSADGSKAERVEPLARTLLIQNKAGEGLPDGAKPVGLWTIQIVGTRPLETLVYVSNMAGQPIVVGTTDHQIWTIERGRIRKMDRSREQR